jgi:hypothetical protein
MSLLTQRPLSRSSHSTASSSCRPSLSPLALLVAAAAVVAALLLLLLPVPSQVLGRRLDGRWARGPLGGRWGASVLPLDPPAVCGRLTDMKLLQLLLVALLLLTALPALAVLLLL